MPSRWSATTSTSSRSRSARRRASTRPRPSSRRLPVTLKIDGPQVQYNSHPALHRPWSDDDGDPRHGPESWGLVRTTADGHRITLRPRRPAAQRAAARVRLDHAGGAARPHAGGVCLRAAHAAAAAATSATASRASARGDFSQPIAQVPARRARRPRAARQHHGHEPAGHARCQARAAAGDQPRAAQPADARTRECRAGGRGRTPRRAAARPVRDARPDQRPAGERAPGHRPRALQTRGRRPGRAGARGGGRRSSARPHSRSNSTRRCSRCAPIRCA